MRNHRLFVPRAGLEPAQPKWSLDFKSSASTNSATWASLKKEERETCLTAGKTGYQHPRQEFYMFKKFDLPPYFIQMKKLNHYNRDEQ